jgi:hypothetical protein
MLIHTPRRIAASQVVLPDDINYQQSQTVQTFNGGLGQHNMPVGKITNAKLAPMVIDNTTWASIDVVSSYGPCNSFHVTDTGVSGANTAVGSIDLASDSHLPAWNSLQDVVTTGAELRFTSQEGMLRGNALIAWERRLGYYFNGASWIPEGRNMFVMFSVFVNGLQIMETGPLYPRRSTVDLPFITPIGSGDCHVAIKWRAITTPLEATNTEPDQTLNIYSVQLSARNQYR